MKTLTNLADLTKSHSRSMFRVTDFAVTTLAGFRKPLVYTLNRVSENRFVRLLAGFIKPDMTVNILSFSPAAYRKGCHSHYWLTETG